MVRCHDRALLSAFPAAGLYYDLKYMRSPSGSRHRTDTLSTSLPDTDEWEWEFELDQWDLSFEKVSDVVRCVL